VKSANAKTYLLLSIILIIGAALILTNLDNQYLWQDEAETAIMAKNIMQFGIPTVYDRGQFISQAWGIGIREGEYVGWSSWIDKYLAALSMSLLGVNTYAARLPFALIGILNIFLIFLLSSFIFQNNKIGILSAGFLTLSVPFLLLSRQCHYYSVTMLATLLAIYFFFAIIRGKKYGIVGFAVSTLILYHSNIFSFFTITLSLLISFLISYKDRKAVIRAITAFIISLAVNLPSILYFDIFRRTAGVERVTSFAANLYFYLRCIHNFLFSFLLLVFFLVFIFQKRNNMPIWKKGIKRDSIFLSCFVMCYLVAVSPLQYSFFRYTASIIPVLTILTSVIVYVLIKSKTKSAYAILSFIILIHFWHPETLWPTRHIYLKKSYRNLFFNYLYEITHDYTGPIKKVISYLNDHAKKKDTVYITYGDYPFRFYTDLNIVGGQSGVDLSGIDAPDWIYIRQFFYLKAGERETKKHYEKNRKLLDRWFNQNRYEKIEFLNTPDLFWENRPSPFFHLFKSPKSDIAIKNAEIYQKL
jgi:hypothetical protein